MIDLSGLAKIAPMLSAQLPTMGIGAPDAGMELPEAPSLAVPPMPAPQARPPQTRDLIMELAPMVLSMFAAKNNPLHAAAILRGMSQGQEAARLQQLDAEQKEQRKREAAAEYMRRVAADAQQFDDPVEFAKYLRFAETAGQHVGIQPGTLAQNIAFPASKAAKAAQAKAASRVRELQAVYGEKLSDPDVQNFTVTFDGKQIKVSDLMGLAGLQITNDKGDGLAAPSKLEAGGNSDEAQYRRVLIAEFKEANKRDPNNSELRQIFEQAKGGRKTAPNFQSREALVGGKRTFVNFDPETGKYFDTRGVEVQASPIPPANAGSGGASSVGSVPGVKTGTPAFKAAQDLAYGRMTFSQFRTLMAYNRDASAKMAIYAKAAELNPEFNPAKFEMGFKFASSPQTQRALAAVDNVMPNIDRIIELSDQWDRTKYPDINKFLGAVRFKMGNRTVANLRQAQKLIGDELGVALGAGTMTDMKLQLGLDVVDPNLPADVFLSNMERVKEFLHNRKQSLLNQMGVYGTPEMNPGADNPDSNAGMVVWTRDSQGRLARKKQ
jgi:hypothetical protein